MNRLIKIVFLALVLSLSFASFGQSEDTDPRLFAEQMPQYLGGEDSLRVFLQRNLTYPPEAEKLGLQGKVMVGFVIEKDGSVSNVEVLNKDQVNRSLAEEAVRVVRLMPAFKPGMQDGQPVRVRFKLPVLFRLSK